MQITRQIVSGCVTHCTPNIVWNGNIAIGSQKSSPRNSMCRFVCQFTWDSSILVDCWFSPFFSFVDICCAFFCEIAPFFVRLHLPKCNIEHTCKHNFALNSKRTRHIDSVLGGLFPFVIPLIGCQFLNYRFFFDKFLFSCHWTLISNQNIDYERERWILNTDTRQFTNIENPETNWVCRRSAAVISNNTTTKPNL